MTSETAIMKQLAEALDYAQNVLLWEEKYRSNKWTMAQEMATKALEAYKEHTKHFPGCHEIRAAAKNDVCYCQSHEVLTDPRTQAILHPETSSG